MKFLTFIWLSITVIFVVMLILLLNGIISFFHLPLSNSSPTWGDVSSIITPFVSFLAAILLLHQINIERKRSKVIHYQNNISKLSLILNDIKHNEYSGTEAIIQFNNNLNFNFAIHPRILIGKINYISSSIESLMKDLNKNKKSLDYDDVESLIVDTLIFYYTNIYFCLTTKNMSSKQTILDVMKVEKSYIIINERLDELHGFLYQYLRMSNTIDEHEESQYLLKYNIKNENYKALLNHLQHNIALK